MTMPSPLKVFYTGDPGVGKSTIVARVKDIILSLGCRVGGFIAPEVRGPSGRRIGFMIIDLATGEQGWLAKVGYPGPRISRYGIVEDDVRRIGVNAILRGVSNADILVIDEIGPMELMVSELRKAIIKALMTNKPTLGVIHRGLKRRDPHVYRIIKGSSRIIVVTLENRQRLMEEAGIIAKELCGEGSNKGREGSTIHTRSE